MIKQIKYTIAFFLMLYLFSCAKKSNKCYWLTRPNHPLFFEIKHNGEFITDRGILSSVKISYYKNNIKQYISDLTVSDTIVTNGTVVNRLISTVNIANISADDIKIFYVEYPDGLGTLDTLYIDYSPPSINNNCNYIFNQIMLNKQLPLVNSSLRLPDPAVLVYIFNKE